MPLYKDDGSDIKLATCTSTYMDKAGDMRLYNSLRMDDPYSPEVSIWIDGVYTFFRFKDRPTPKFSNDGSLEWLSGQPKTHVIKYSGYQVDKRMQYLKAAEELGCDVIIVIDSDEYIHPDYNDWQEFRKWLVKYIRSYDSQSLGLIFNLMLWSDKDYVRAYNAMGVDQFHNNARIWHRPEKLEYYNGVHYWFHRRNTSDPGERLGSTIHTIEYGIRLMQDSKLRNEAYLDSRDRWAASGIYHEDGLIKKYTMEHNLPYYSVVDIVFGKKERRRVRNLYPLLAIITNHYNPKIINDIKNITNMDKIFLDGYKTDFEAFGRARRHVIKDGDYSHLLITSDKFHITKYEVDKLLVSASKSPYVVTGYFKTDDRLSFSTDEVHFRPKLRQLRYETDTNFIKDENGLIEVKYTDFALMAIPTDILLDVETENTPDNQYMINFCWDIIHNHYKLLVDPTLEIKLDDKLERKVSPNPSVIINTKKTEIDSFVT